MKLEKKATTNANRIKSVVGWTVDTVAICANHLSLVGCGPDRLIIVHPYYEMTMEFLL